MLPTLCVSEIIITIFPFNLALKKLKLVVSEHDSPHYGPNLIKLVSEREVVDGRTCEWFSKNDSLELA